jgi:hypothetical protein
MFTDGLKSNKELRHHSTHIIPSNHEVAVLHWLGQHWAVPRAAHSIQVDLQAQTILTNNSYLNNSNRPISAQFECITKETGRK